MFQILPGDAKAHRENGLGKLPIFRLAECPASLVIMIVARTVCPSPAGLFLRQMRLPQRAAELPEHLVERRQLGHLAGETRSP